VEGAAGVGAKEELPVTNFILSQRAAAPPAPKTLEQAVTGVLGRAAQADRAPRTTTLSLSRTRMNGPRS
jgi:hypothetical protein